MKSILPGVAAFLICLTVYTIMSSYITNERYYAYRKGFTDGFCKKTEVEIDSIDAETAKHRHKIDSLFNLIMREAIK